MRRRAFLTAAGASLLALAGCQDSTDDPSAPTPRGEGTDTATPTATPADAEVTVEEITLQQGIVMATSPDSIGVEFEDARYVWADVAVDGPLPRDAFAFAVGEERVSPTTVEGSYRTSWGGEAYEPGTGGLLLFPMSEPRTVESAGLRWPGGERPADETFLRRLSTPTPELSVSVEAPEAHDPSDGAPLALTMSVTNDGDVPGQFLCAITREGPDIAATPVGRVAEPVPAGETVAAEVEDDWGTLPESTTPGSDGRAATYYFDWVGGEETRTVAVE